MFAEKTEEVLQKFATIYQDYMKKIELPNNSQLLLPFTTWQGLGITLKQLYGQPLHYLTNVELHKWDNLRTGTGYEHIPLDRLIHPFVAEALIRQLENMHRLITPPSYLLKLWLANPIYSQFIDPIWLAFFSFLFSLETYFCWAKFSPFVVVIVIIIFPKY